MIEQPLPEEFLAFLKTIKGKRSTVVVNHILEHGYITTEELETQYGYSHPPRAVRDVREQGVLIETFSVKSAEGRTIAAYRFAAPFTINPMKTGGRQQLPKAFRTALIKQAAYKCAVCGGKFDSRYLQVDHRIPYEVRGDAPGEPQPEDYMVICAACNRAKSWSCEHCENGLKLKNPALCKNCYWVNPESYHHIALRPIRRLDLVWTENEIDFYQQLKQLADENHTLLPDYVKNVLENHTKHNNSLPD